MIEIAGESILNIKKRGGCSSCRAPKIGRNGHGYNAELSTSNSLSFSRIYK